MIEYYIDGSTKDNMIGAGVLKVNEFGFIEKYHFNIEHINPSSNIAEGYSLEKTLELIEKNDIDKNEMIDIYTDSKRLQNSLVYNENIKFNRGKFSKQEANNYFQYLREFYLSLISKYSNSPSYHCFKTNQARPLIKLHFKEDTENKNYLQEAHLLSRNYIKEVADHPKVELKARKEKDKWIIIKDNKNIVAENKRPIIALSDALKQIDSKNKEIKLCNNLENLLKCTYKNKLSSESMKTAIKIIENHKFSINL